MNLVVNGEPREVLPHTTVEQLAPTRRGIAVAVNGAVVPRSTWPVAVLHEGDRVELLEAAQGG